MHVTNKVLPKGVEFKKYTVFSEDYGLEFFLWFEDLGFECVVGSVGVVGLIISDGVYPVGCFFRFCQNFSTPF